MSTVYNDPVMTDSTGQDIVTKLNTIAGLMGDGVIDDTTASATKTYSSNKISGLIGTLSNLATTAKNNLVAAINELVTSIANRVDWASNRVIGAKNLLYIHIDNLKLYNTSGTWVDNKYTLNNVEFDISVNSAGFVTSIAVKSTGTGATANTDLRLYRESGSIAWLKTLPKGIYILNGVQGGSTSTYYLQINKQNASGNEVEGCKCTNGDANLDTSESLNGYINYWFQVNNETVVDTVIYPMLRLAIDTDSIFVPHAMTNQQLTDLLTVKETEATITGQTVDTNMGNHVIKSGNVVTFMIGLTGVSVTAYTSTGIELPEGFRPKTGIDFVVKAGSDYVNAILLTNGRIQFRSDISNKQVFLSGTFITS